MSSMLIGLEARKEEEEAGDTYFSRIEVGMSQMIEVFLRDGAGSERSMALELASLQSGRLTFEEIGKEGAVRSALCLTFEFDSWEQAFSAVQELNARGFYVEGPYDY